MSIPSPILGANFVGLACVFECIIEIKENRHLLLGQWMDSRDIGKKQRWIWVLTFGAKTWLIAWTSNVSDISSFSWRPATPPIEYNWTIELSRCGQRRKLLRWMIDLNVSLHDLSALCLSISSFLWQLRSHLLKVRRLFLYHDLTCWYLIDCQSCHRI